MNGKEIQSRSSNRGLSITNLAQMLFKGEASEDYIRALPPQSLYLAVKHLGLTSSADILEMATLEQCRLLFDFDCWQRDTFKEEAFWEWLSIADDEHGLRLLQKFLKFVDLKLVSLMIARHVETKVFEEKTDNPPAPGFYTPDQGFTWVHVKVEEGTRNFLLSRLLALIFETDADLFYQLLSVPGVATETELEEESYQARAKRVQAEGFPSDEYAFELNSPLDEASFMAKLSQSPRPQERPLIPSIEPIVYESLFMRPLSELAAAAPREDFEAELTLIMNAAFVRWGVDISDEEQVRHWIGKVRGALNIGIEVALLQSNRTVSELYDIVGLGSLYRLGLARLQKAHREAEKLSEETLRRAASDTALFALIAGMKERFPEVPVFFNPDGTIDAPGGQLRPGFRSFDHVSELDAALRVIRERVSSEAHSQK